MRSFLTGAIYTTIAIGRILVLSITASGGGWPKKEFNEEDFFMAAGLTGRIKNRTARLAVIGLGYVGLPLAVNFARAGFKVFGLDTDHDRVEQVNRKKSYILDIADQKLAQAVGLKAMFLSSK